MDMSTNGFGRNIERDDRSPIGVWNGRRDLSQNFPMTESEEEVMAVLCYAARQGCQDVIFQTGTPVMMNMKGALVALSEWRYDFTDWMRTAKAMVGKGSDVETRLAGGRSFNKAVEARDRIDRDEYGEARAYRFRVNISACQFGDIMGGQIVCRFIPSRPPTVQDIGLEEDIIAESTPTMGSIILSGPTGSGKTTTFAALQRRVMEVETAIEGNVLTLEEPIEFMFDSIVSNRCIIAQAEIPTHFETFEIGIQEAMRRVPRLIVIGEQRNYQTMAAGQEAANTGHTVYTTVHANTAALAIPRIVGKFPETMREQAFEMAVSTTHMVVSQVLVTKRDGERTCLREWMIMDDEMRDELAKIGFVGANKYLRQHMREGKCGRAMIDCVKERYTVGDISAETAAEVLQRYGYSRSERVM